MAGPDPGAAERPAPAGQGPASPRRRPAHVPLDEAAEAEVGVEGSQADTEARLDILAAIRSLGPEHREVVVLREIEGLSYEEMAEVLDVPRGTVESRLFRARRELQERLKDYLE